MAADGQGVIIEEIGIPFRTLILSGKDAPEPMRVGTRQRATQTWYPGASKASVQVMGFAEEPLVLKGRWHNDELRLAGQGPEDLKAIALGLLQGQQRCRITWGTTVSKLGRVGKVDVDLIRDKDMLYEIRFDVDQSNEAVALAPPPPGVAVVRNLIEAADKALDAIAATKAIADQAVSIGSML